MLSSIAEQKGQVPEIVFDIAYPKENGTPTTEEICDFFDPYVNISSTKYPDERSMQYRGLVRNKQLEKCDTDWILFADCDMVYDSLFFDDLNKQLISHLKDETRCISASRISLDKDYSKKYFNEIDDASRYPCLIKDAAKQLQFWPIYQRSRSVGAGYFQLANVKNIRDNHGGIYVDESRCKDNAEFDNYHKTRSDGQFRGRIGGIRKIRTMPQYHLNHERDNEVGKHIDFQR